MKGENSKMVDQLAEEPSQTQLMIPVPSDTATVKDNKVEPRPAKDDKVPSQAEQITFPMPDCDSVVERFKNMDKIIQDFKLGDVWLSGISTFIISENKAVFVDLKGTPDNWNTIHVVDLEK